jgi:hypothetical protein
MSSAHLNLKVVLRPQAPGAASGRLAFGAFRLRSGAGWFGAAVRLAAGALIGCGSFQLPRALRRASGASASALLLLDD